MTESYVERWAREQKEKKEKEAKRVKAAEKAKEGSDEQNAGSERQTAKKKKSDR